jgi:hypothetical protein
MWYGMYCIGNWGLPAGRLGELSNYSSRASFVPKCEIWSKITSLGYFKNIS